MSHATLYIGDVFEVMATMPDDSVDLVLTSPPFLALRSYLPADHPDKDKEIGSEATPAEFLDTLLALTAEWGRLIGPYGSIAVELGDTYAGSGGAGGDYDTGERRGDQAKFKGSALADRKNKVLVDGKRLQQGNGWPDDKSLCCIPQLYEVALAYGINPLTGTPSPAGRWRVRNLVAWCRPNPPVGALGDKFRPGTSYMTIATKARNRWFDLDAVRTEYKGHARTAQGVDRQSNTTKQSPDGNRDTLDTVADNGGGAPPLDWWEISTEAYAGSHYATWPRKLLERPIKAMCPSEVCRQCGEPRRRITEASYEHKSWTSGGTRNGLSRQPDRVDQTYAGQTTGWSSCGHDDYRHGIVLDPFGGSGTTGLVSTGHGRDCIMIDIDGRNADLARERIGMFLTVVDHGDLKSERCS